MSRHFVLRELAEADINKAVVWYERQRAGLGREFLREIRSMLDQIALRPESFPVYRRGARRALVHRVPYRIFFILETDAISVVAVFHGKQSERRLRGRL